MVFLDAHCECVQGWLEALISPIVERRTIVPAPIIDVIDYETMQVRTANINSRGAFDLSLSFTWDRIPNKYLARLNNDRTASIESPAMAGTDEHTTQIIFKLVIIITSDFRWFIRNRS